MSIKGKIGPAAIDNLRLPCYWKDLRNKRWQNTHAVESIFVKFFLYFSSFQLSFLVDRSIYFFVYSHYTFLWIWGNTDVIPAGCTGKNRKYSALWETCWSFWDVISRIFPFIRKCNEKFVTEKYSPYVKLRNF